MILAFLAANFVMVLIQSLITLVFMHVVYKVPLHGNLAWILIILILQGFCGMCFGNLQNHVLWHKKMIIFFLGFFLASAFSNHASYVHAAIGCFFPIFTLSGSFWPLEGVPDGLKMVAWYLPCTYSIQAVRDVMTKGTLISAQLAFITTFVWILIFVLAAIITIKIRSPR